MSHEAQRDEKHPMNGLPVEFDMANAERVIKKHITIERQLGQMKALLGVMK